MCEILLGLGGVRVLEVVECEDDTVEMTVAYNLVHRLAAYYLVR